MVEQSFLISILEFIGLALPAIAILMQVVLTLNKDSSGGDMDFDTLPTEFRVFELALYAMILGGVLLGYELYKTLSSPFVKGGTILIYGSLPFLAVGIWFALRRQSFSGSSFNSVEDYVSTTIRKETIFLIPATIPAVIFPLITGIIFFLLREFMVYGLFEEFTLFNPIYLALLPAALVALQANFRAHSEIPEGTLDVVEVSKMTLNSCFYVLLVYLAIGFSFLLVSLAIMFVSIAIGQNAVDNPVFNLPVISWIVAGIVTYLLPLESLLDKMADRN